MIPDVITECGNFQTLHLLWKVFLLVCFAYIWGKASSLFILTFVFRSDHGQPPSDEPRVADSYWYLSLQHSAGWELHPALTWRLQLYRLAPHVCVCVCVRSLVSMCVCVYSMRSAYRPSVVILSLGTQTHYCTVQGWEIGPSDNNVIF